MSLLMKALANAEESKHALQNDQASSNVFTRNHRHNALFSKFITLLIVALLFGIAWFAYQIYQLNQAESSQSQAKLANTPASINTQSVNKNDIALLAGEEVVELPSTAPISTNKQKPVVKKTKAKSKPKQTIATVNEKPVATKTIPSRALVEGEVNSAETTLVVQAPLEQAKPSAEKIANENSTRISDIKVAHKAGALVKDQTLETAYAAFQGGDFTKAKQYYRLVLQKNTGQVDALLGMAAIAQKQGRLADAGGWYKKVLNVSPNNPTALSGMMAAAPQMDSFNQEARLKKLITKQPSHAQHHANLGNFYASRSAWDKAQSAFFEASRYAKDNAQYAYNLAISLEHLGKPSLAVQHYKRALAMVKLQQLSVPNPAQIQQRIDVLQ